jgi:tetratricopeptide (TPR) repeat protein
MFSKKFKIIVAFLIVITIGIIAYQYPISKNESAYNKMVQIGQEAANNKQYPMAVNMIRAALDIHPLHYDLYPALATGEIFWGIDMVDQQGATAHYQEAIRLMDVYIDHIATNSEAWIHRGMAQYSLKNYEKAAANFSKAMELNPEDAVARKLFVDAINKKNGVKPKVR